MDTSRAEHLSQMINPLRQWEDALQTLELKIRESNDSKDTHVNPQVVVVVIDVKK